MDTELRMLAGEERIRSWVLLSPTIFLATFLAYYKLESKSLWIDEITTVQISTGSFSAILESLKHMHNAPPFYYLILHLFTLMDTSEFIVRLPSVIFGILAVCVFYQVARHLFGRNVGLLAVLLLVLSPLHLRYTQEARMYTLFELTAMLSLYFFYKGVETRRVRSWIGYTATTLAGMYTHYFTVFYVASQGLFLFIITLIPLIASRRRTSVTAECRRTWQGFALSLFAIFLFYLPWLPSALADTTGSGFYQSFTEVLSDTFHRLWAGQTTTLVYFLGSLVPIGLIASFLTQPARKAILLGCWVIPPLPLVYVFLLRAQSFFAIRYLIFILPIYVLLVAYAMTVGGRVLTDLLQRRCGFTSYPSGVSLALAMLVIGPLNVMPLQRYYSQPKLPWREVGAFLNRHVQPDEVVVVQPPYETASVQFYSHLTQIFGKVTPKQVHELTQTHSTIWYVFKGQANVARAMDQWMSEQRSINLIFRGYNPDGDIVDIQISLHRRTWQEDADALNEGLALIADAQTLWPEVLRSDLALARLFARYHYFTKAVEHYERAANDAPASLAVKIYLELGELLRGQGDVVGAVETYQRLVELRPKDASYRILLADALIDTNKVDEALAEYKQVVALMPDYGEKAWYHVRLGNAYRLASKSTEAIAAYERALALDPNKADVWQKLGDVYVDGERLEEAVLAYRWAVQLEPDNVGILSRLCRTYNRLGAKYEAEAMETCQQAVTLDPFNAWFRILLGDAYVASQNVDEALAEYKEAACLEPSYWNQVWYQMRLGDTYYLLGQTDEAIEAYQKVLDLAPTHHGAKKKLENLHRQSGRLKEEE